MDLICKVIARSLLRRGREAFFLGALFSLAGLYAAGGADNEIEKAFQTDNCPAVFGFYSAAQKANAKSNYYAGACFLQIRQIEKSAGLFLKALAEGNETVRYHTLERLLVVVDQAKEKKPKLYKRIIKEVIASIPKAADQAEAEMILPIVLRGKPHPSIVDLLQKYPRCHLPAKHLKSAIVIINQYKGYTAVKTFMGKRRTQNARQYYEAYGDFLWQSGRYDEARALYEDAFQKTRKSDYLRRKGLLYIEEGNTTEGYKTWERLLSEQPNPTQGYTDVARIYFDNGRSGKALAIIHQAEQKGIRLDLMKAQILGLTGRPKQAVKVYCRAIIEQRYSIHQFKKKLTSLNQQSAGYADIAAAMVEYLAFLDKNSNADATGSYIQVYGKLMPAGVFERRRSSILSALQGVYLLNGDFQKAKNLAWRVSSNHYEGRFYYFYFIDGLLKDGLYTEAKQALELPALDEDKTTKAPAAAGAFRPGYIYRQYLWCRYYLRRKNPEKAAGLLKHLQPVTGRLTGDQINTLEGKIWELRGKRQKALQYYLAGGSDAKEDAVRLALILGKTKIATNLLKRFEHSSADYYRGILAFKNKKYQKSYFLLKKSINKLSDSGLGTNALFYLYLWSIEEAAGGKPKDFKALPVALRIGLGDYAVIGDINKRLKETKKPKTIDFLYYLRAIARIERAEYKQAAADIKKIIDNNRTKVLLPQAQGLYASFKKEQDLDLQFLQKFADSPYSFFSRERLQSKVVP